MTVDYSEVENYLEHYGVLGMKWGVRKDGNPERTARRSAEKEVRSDERARKQAVKNRGYNSKSAKEARATIKVKSKTNPEYKAAMLRIQKREQAIKAAVGIAAYAAILGGAYVMTYEDDLKADFKRRKQEAARQKYMKHAQSFVEKTIDNSGHLVIKDLGGGKWDYRQF